MSTAEVFEAITALTPAEKASLLSRLALETTRLESASTPRPSGLARGEFFAPEDFDAPLPADVLADFEIR